MVDLVLVNQFCLPSNNGLNSRSGPHSISTNVALLKGGLLRYNEHLSWWWPLDWKANFSDKLLIFRPLPVMDYKSAKTFKMNRLKTEGKDWGLSTWKTFLMKGVGGGYCKTLPSNLPEAGCSIFIRSVGQSSSSRFVTINSTSIKPSIKVRNLTYHIIGESLWCWQPIAHINHDKDTHKDKYKDKEKRKLPRRKGSSIEAKLLFCNMS